MATSTGHFQKTLLTPWTKISGQHHPLNPNSKEVRIYSFRSLICIVIFVFMAMAMMEIWGNKERFGEWLKLRGSYLLFLSTQLYSINAHATFLLFQDPSMASSSHSTVKGKSSKNPHLNPQDPSSHHSHESGFQSSTSLASLENSAKLEIPPNDQISGGSTASGSSSNEPDSKSLIS